MIALCRTIGQWEQDDSVVGENLDLDKEIGNKFSIFQEIYKIRYNSFYCCLL